MGLEVCVLEGSSGDEEFSEGAVGQGEELSKSSVVILAQKAHS